MPVELDSMRGELAWPNGDRGNKVTHDAFNGMNRDAPDPKETEDMIDPKGVKIAGHLLEPLLPFRHGGRASAKFTLDLAIA